MKHFLVLRDLPADVVKQVVATALNIKRGSFNPTIEGKTVGLIFEKPSTRTRISLEVGVAHMKGHPVVLTSKEMQLGRGESVADTARVLSRYLDAVAIRTFEHSRLEEFSRYSSIPVINALSDSHHPLQLLADIMTIIERKGQVEGIKVAYVGDVNNVCNSWIEGTGIFGYALNIATPPGWEPDKEHIKILGGSNVRIFTDPVEACRGVDVIATDVWVSMGMEDEKEKRIQAFKNYSVSERLVEVAGDGVVVLHCLPAYKGFEITEEIFERFCDVIMDEAENRLHTAKALIHYLLKD